MNSKLKYLIMAAVILSAGFAFAIIGYSLGRDNKQKQTVILTTPTILQNTESPTVTSTAAVDLRSSVKDTGVVNQKKYTNPGYKISFIFPSKVEDGAVDVKELGNKIYVYNTKYSYASGQYVEVFTKTAGDSLEQAIQNKFLANIPVKDCFVKEAKPDSGANFPSNFLVKTIGFPIDQNSEVPSFEQSSNCPSPYTESNGLSYFLMDVKHPGIFLFFSIGQYAFYIDNKSNKTWQDTIEFLD